MKTGRRPASSGFTLIELMITIAILAILMGVALPSYQNQVVRTRRAAAAVCVTELAQFMERVYAASNSYADNNGTATALPATPCQADLSSHYGFAFTTGQPQARSFVIQATPINMQAERDAPCGGLTMDQAGAKGITGASTVAQCWK